MGRGARGTRALGALLAVGTVLLVGCSSEPPPPPRERIVELDATANGAVGAVSGRFVLTGPIDGNAFRVIQDLPFSTSFPVPYVPAPKIQITLVDVPPGTPLSCRIRIDGETIVEETVSAPGETVNCIVE